MTRTRTGLNRIKVLRSQKKEYDGKACDSGMQTTAPCQSISNATGQRRCRYQVLVSLEGILLSGGTNMARSPRDETL